MIEKDIDPPTFEYTDSETGIRYVFQLRMNVRALWADIHYPTSNAVKYTGRVISFEKNPPQIAWGSSISGDFPIKVEQYAQRYLNNLIFA